MSELQTMGWADHGSGGAVAAGTQEGVAAGIAVLRDGGNAVDAAIASILALSVSHYGMFAFGGEVPFMFYNASTRNVQVLSGQGVAPRSREGMAWFEANGIPSDGDVKTAPPPAVLDLCTTALRLYGTTSFEHVASYTRKLLEPGLESWHTPLAATLARLVEAEKQTQGGREERLLGVRNRFYEGDIADALEAYYVSEGSFLRKTDLASHTTLVEDPVSVTYHDHTVYKCGPWTQGPWLCQALRLLETFDLQHLGHLSEDYIHTVTEAMKLALADRDAYYADPRFADVPLAALFSEKYAKLRRTLMDPERAATSVPPGDPRAMKPRCDAVCDPDWVGGTTTCVVSDRFGNVVSATPSANRPYHLCDELGIAHGNRLRCLNTTPGHPNHIEAGKRPRVTLTPTLVVKADGSVLAVSVAGGDLQDQTTLNCLLNHLDFGMTPAESVTAPRFSTGHHENSFKSDAKRGAMEAPAGLVLDDGIGEEAAARLQTKGHQVKRAEAAIAHPVMLHLDAKTGVSHAAGDPKAGRYAQAIQ
ncbi:MAG: hypothetical protein HN380_09545 [Victivallales bacterium]|nr:hypothetical protein [Victivallales bacterium]